MNKTINSRVIAINMPPHEAFDLGWQECLKANNGIRNKTIEECKKAIKEYFYSLIDNNPEWEIDSINDYALKPNKAIQEILEGLKK